MRRVGDRNPRVGGEIAGEDAGTDELLVGAESWKVVSDVSLDPRLGGHSDPREPDPDLVRPDRLLPRATGPPVGPGVCRIVDRGWGYGASATRIRDSADELSGEFRRAGGELPSRGRW